MKYELGSIIAAIGAIFTGIITIIISIYNAKKGIEVSEKNLELAERNFNGTVIEQNKNARYSRISDNLAIFLKYASAIKLQSFYKRAIIKKQAEDSISYINELFMVMEKIDDSSNIFKFYSYEDEELFVEIVRCKDNAMRILNLCMDIKVGIEGAEVNYQNLKAGVIDTTDCVTKEELLEQTGVYNTIFNTNDAISEYFKEYNEVKKKVFAYTERIKKDLDKID